jgi:hypothetical protein
MAGFNLSKRRGNMIGLLACDAFKAKLFSSQTRHHFLLQEGMRQRAAAQVVAAKEKRARRT